MTKLIEEYPSKLDLDRSERGLPGPALAIAMAFACVCLIVMWGVFLLWVIS